MQQMILKQLRRREQLTGKSNSKEKKDKENYQKEKGKYWREGQKQKPQQMLSLHVAKLHEMGFKHAEGELNTWEAPKKRETEATGRQTPT